MCINAQGMCQRLGELKSKVNKYMLYEFGTPYKGLKQGNWEK